MLGDRNKKNQRTVFCRGAHGEMTAKNGSIHPETKKKKQFEGA